MTPQKALEYLEEGNQRFLNNLRVNRNLLHLVDDIKEKQFPFAVILSCSDSRTTAELIFDQSLGDLFSIRLAGNIANIEAVASMEYACTQLGSKLIVVMGHTHCGAVKGACDRVELGNLHHLLEHIYPAIEMESTTTENRTASNTEFVQNVADISVGYQIRTIIGNSEILSTMLKNGEIDIVGAMYDLASGVVTFKPLHAFSEASFDLNAD